MSNIIIKKSRNWEACFALVLRRKVMEALEVSSKYRPDGPVCQFPPCALQCLVCPSHLQSQILKLRVTAEMGPLGRDLRPGCGWLGGQECEFPISRDSSSPVILVPAMPTPPQPRGHFNQASALACVTSRISTPWVSPKKVSGFKIWAVFSNDSAATLRVTSWHGWQCSLQCWYQRVPGAQRSGLLAAQWRLLGKAPPLSYVFPLKI